jgi:hypothetical protein
MRLLNDGRFLRVSSSILKLDLWELIRIGCQLIVFYEAVKV